MAKVLTMMVKVEGHPAPLVRINAGDFDEKKHKVPTEKELAAYEKKQVEGAK